MSATHHQIPRARPKATPRYVRTWSGVEHGGEPAGIIDCNGHHRGDNAFLCGDCAADLAHHLRDIPALLTELHTALVGDVRFPERGHSRDRVISEESPVPFNGRARKAMARLVDVLHYPTVEHRRQADRHPVWAGSAAAKWMLSTLRMWLINPDVGELANEISRAVVAGRSAIERPADLVFYGYCPSCSEGIRQERVKPDDRTAMVVCGKCGYTGRFDEHVLANLDAGEDRWLTMDELIGAIESAPGETVTRQQILRWRDHHGLPRDERAILVGGQLQRLEVFRLGDVRRFAETDRLESDSFTSAELAVRWAKKPEQIKLLVSREKLTPIRVGAKPLRFTRQEVERFEARLR